MLATLIAPEGSLSSTDPLGDLEFSCVCSVYWDS